ncbi:thiamine diphosphokinase [uncultured Roseobacter sp.]|uniref:thiamine diphosphokinase n=1 Tax=uncultured Roseobacter sp. TaxID=114847 RepID=UPI002601A0D9|nr:thiamine diphosphokinase [uncultured Roseobacter sp.]
MKNPLYISDLPLILAGGGPVGADDFVATRAFAPDCVAADGGAGAALKAGIMPQAVIGDMDSLPPSVRDRLPSERIHHIAEQDSTDFDKALRNVSAPLILGVGFAGGRIDHQLSVFHTLTVRCEMPVLLLGAEDVIFLCPPVFRMAAEPGLRVSLFPMGPVTGRSQGLEWPIDGLDFAPGLRSGTSNRATGDIHLEMDAPMMLCLMPRESLAAVAAALLRPEAPGRWPARAERYRDLPPSL